MNERTGSKVIPGIQRLAEVAEKIKAEQRLKNQPPLTVESTELRERKPYLSR